MADGERDLGVPGVLAAVEVGRGGFATVYRARQPALERDVAIKIVHPGVLHAADDYFAREVRAASRLSQHPNVVPIYDVGTTSSGQAYLMMPYYERGSLAALIGRRGALTEQMAVRIGRTLANTLDYVHQRGVLHRDVKPANILLGEGDEPLLGDFGVARVASASMALQTIGTNVVTWAYGPPEAFTGGEPSPAWDIYSLGATVYTMLTGAAPFIDDDDANVFAVLNRIGNVEVPDLTVRGVSPAVAAAVRQAMAKAPEDRPPSAAAFGSMLVSRTPPSPRPAPVSSSPASPPPAPTPAEPAATPIVAASVEAVMPASVPAEPVVVEPAFFEPAVVEPALVEPAAVGSLGVSAADGSVAESGAEGSVAKPAAVEPAVPAHRGERREGAGLVVMLAIVAVVAHTAGLLVNVFSSDSADAVNSLDDDFWGTTFPAVKLVLLWGPSTALLAGLVLLKVRSVPRGVAFEWIIGAAAAMFVLDVMFDTSGYLLANLELITPVMFALRIVVPGVATVLIVLLAWRRARQPGPTARANQRWLLLAGCGLVTIATLLVVGEFETGLLWLATVAALLALVLVRSFAMPARTTGAATLVAAGSVNALCWLARILGDPQYLLPDGSGMQLRVFLAAAGSACIAVVGVWRWWAGAAPAQHSSGPSRAAVS
jgi:hypothetical protein